MEVWVYTRTFDDAGAVFSLGRTGSAGRDFALRVRDSDNRWRGQFWSDHDIDFEYPSLNRWVHFAVVHTGEKTVIYADGEPIAEREQELDTSTREPFRIGMWSHRDTAFNGMIADVRIWNKALDHNEIKARVNESLSGDEDGLAGYWPLNEGAGNTVKDVVAGHDGRFVGEPQWVLARPFESDLAKQKMVRSGDTVELGPVKLRGPEGEVTYQWYGDGEPIEGATQSRLTLSEIGETDPISYYVEVDDAREVTPIRSGTLRLAFPDRPMWRYDAERSAQTPVQLSEDLHLLWGARAPGARARMAAPVGRPWQAGF